MGDSLVRGKAEARATPEHTQKRALDEIPPRARVGEREREREREREKERKKKRKKTLKKGNWF